jgi:hypothetical protein
LLCVWFEFGINSNSNLISSFYSKTLFPSLKPLAGPASPKARCGSNYLTGPATQPAISAQQPHPLTLSSLAVGQGPHVSHRLPSPSSSFLLRFVLRPVNPAGALGRATRWARQPSGPHAEGRSALRVPDPTEGGGKDLNAPHRAHPRPEQAAATGSTCPFPANGQGHWGQSTPGCLWPLFKRAPGKRGTDAKPPTPLGFSTRHRPCLRRFGRRRKRATAASLRAREEPGARPEQGHLPRRDAIDTPRTSPSTAARGKERRPSASEKGAGPEQGHLHRRERLLRHATARPRPGYDYTAAPT